jgi:hypothetical protein
VRKRVAIRQGAGKYDNERVPTREELQRILDVSPMREKVAASLIAFCGFRPQVFGDFLGMDGLVLGDVPEMEVAGRVTSVLQADDNPIVTVPAVLPIAPKYDDEIYLSNRIQAFERDGWKCTRCGSREKLQAHHLEPIPKGGFDPIITHRTENLQTLCSVCHLKLPKQDKGNAETTRSIQ